MSILERGTYVLINAHYRSFAALVRDTDDAPAVAETLPVGEEASSEIGHKWTVVENQNGTYGFRNETYNSLWAWHPENKEVQATRYESQAKAAWRIVRLPGAHGFLIKTLREDLCWHLEFPDHRTPIILVPPAQANKSLWIFRNPSTGKEFPSDVQNEKDVPPRMLEPTPSPFKDVDDTVIFDFQSETPATYKLDVVVMQSLNEHNVVVGRTANSTRAALKRISDDLLKLADASSLHIDVRVGAVSFADKCSTVWPLVTPQQLASQASEDLPQSVRDNHLHFDDGVDSFSAALKRALGMDWRKTAAKTVMFVPMANVMTDEPDANSEKDELIRRLETQNVLLSVIAKAATRDQYLESTPLFCALRDRKPAQTATLSNDAFLGWTMASATAQNDLAVLTSMLGPRAHIGLPSDVAPPTNSSYGEREDSGSEDADTPKDVLRAIKPITQDDSSNPPIQSPDSGPAPNVVSVQPRMPCLTPPILVFPSPEQTEQRSLSPESGFTVDLRHADDPVLTVFDFLSTRTSTNQLDVVFIHIQEDSVDFQRVSQQVLEPIKVSLSVVNMRVGHVIVRKTVDQCTFTRISLGIPAWWQSNEQRCRTFAPSQDFFYSAINEALKMDWRGEAAKAIIFMPVLGPVQNASLRASDIDKDKLVFQLRKRGMLFIMDADQTIRDQYLHSTSFFRTLRDRFPAVSLRRSHMAQWITASSFEEQKISSLVSKFPQHAKLWEIHSDDSEDDRIASTRGPPVNNWNPWGTHSDNAHSMVVSGTELTGNTPEGRYVLDEAARALHAIFTHSSNSDIHYALCGPYALALMGFSPLELKGLDCVVPTEVFQHLRDLFVTHNWCNWRFENGHVTIHFRSSKGLVRVRCIDAGYLGSGLQFVLGVGGSIMQTSYGLFTLRITHVIRVMTIASYRLQWQESVADVLRLIGKFGLPLDLGELTIGLNVPELEYLHLYIRGLDEPFYVEPTTISFPTPNLTPVPLSSGARRRSSPSPSRARKAANEPSRHLPSTTRGNTTSISNPVMYMPQPFNL